MRLRVRGKRLEGRWKAALTARRLADGSDDMVAPDTGVAVLEDGRGGVARRSRKKTTPRAWSCSPGRAMSRLLCRLAGVLLAAGLAVLWAVPAHADPEDGDLRLRGGPSHNEGRLEIFRDNEWGTVCDDFFGRRDAKVACKQMGYTGAEAYLTDVAVASGRRFWLDDVNCIGNEENLTECFYNSNVRNSSSRTSPQWGIANCIPTEQVGVRCTATGTDNSVLFNRDNLTVQEQGGGSSYTVRLGKAPTGNVTVAITGQSGTVLIDDTSLTFTTGNWSTPQTVTLTAADDTNRTDNSFTLNHTASGGGYGSVTASLSVTVEDDDGPVQAHIDSGGIVSLTEGGSRTYRIWLDSAPTEQVTVAVTAPSKVSVNPTSLTFTTGNWSTPQTVTLEASHDTDTSDETQYVTHRATKGGYTTTLSRVQVEITDDDDGEDQIGSRPSGAVWWAALTARRETGGATGHIDYTSPHADTGKLSNDSFTYGGVTRAIDGLFVDRNGHFQIWVHSGNGSVLPNGSVLHVGSESLTLGSATRQSFRTMYNDGKTPIMREHAYWWQSGSHGVSLSDRQVVAVWLEVPAGSELPGVPRSVNAQARDGKASLEWGAPPEVPSKPVTSYEYQQEGTETWNSTGGTATTKEVTGLANGESYTFRVRAVNAAGKGAASAPTPAVTPAAPGLTAAFTSVPEAHDGSTAFALQIEFSEDVAGRLRRMRNDVFEVTGGAVADLRRVNRRRDLWTVTVTPSSDDAVTVAVPANRACDVSGAVCTADGEQLSSRAEATVPGPQPAVSVSASTSPVTEGTAAAFTLTRTGDTAAALTVTVSVSEDGAVLAGTPPTEAVFAAGSATVDLTVETEDDEVVGDGSVVTVSLVAGTGYAVDANASAATVTVEDDDGAAENAPPTGLLTVAGTARVGETLTASAADIVDADGLASANFAWQWIANDGTADADIAGATGSTYTPTAAEVGKTLKVRVAFTDDGGSGETLVSAATATVAAVLPAVSVEAAASSVTEGAAAAFTLSRLGDTAAALTVSVSVSEDGAVLAGTPPTEAVFAAGAATVDFTVATEDDEVAGDGSVVTVSLVAGTGYAVDANASEAMVTVEDDDATPENAAPTGLPTIAGTVRVGETLTAATSGIADADGLTNAVFTWQWIANDGTADTDISGATSASYTLTSAEAGKTIKVHVTFTDDGGIEETLVSNATVAVAAALPVVSVEAASSTTTEGRAAKFTLKRTGAVASALEVSVSATQAGAVLSGTPASTVTFAAGNAEARLRLATDDDDVAEADGRVTVSVVSGSGYGVDANASAATVDVYDNDEATTTTAETLWTSTLTVESIGGALLGTVGGGNALSPDGWSEDGEAFEVEQLYYFPQYSELAFTLSVAPSETGQLTLHLDDLQVQLRGSPGVRYFYWVVDHPGWQAGQTVAVKLTRTEPDAVAVAGPGLSVADTQVREAEGAVLSFRVTLEEAQASTVSVRYATSDGTATAGADYEAVSGALRFGPGETAKTVSVPVLNDAHDEGSETLTLALSAPFGAEVADGTATGTIVNTGPMPRAWITRFGRTVGLQAIEAIGDRLSGAGGTEVVVGGVGLSGPGAYAGTPLGEQADWPMGPEDEAWSPDGDNGRGMTGRELLLGSSFRLGAGGEDGAPSVTAWGRVASSSFDGEEAGMSLSGDVTTGFLGADMAHDSWLAGLAVGVSEGEGSFDDGAGDGRGTVESSLTSVYPYARFGLGDGVDIWGLVGMGSGDLKLTVGEEEFRTDLSMQMGALGLRGEVVPAEEAGDIELAVKTDVMWVRTESDTARSSTGGNLEAASGDVSRVRVALEGSRALAAGPGATFTPTLEIGLRHDAGDAETGTGVEVAAGLRYVDLAQGLTVEGNVRGLLTHSDEGYEEWGASGSIRLDPGVSGRGVSLSIGPVWGAASGGVDQLWAAGSPAGLAVDGASEAEARLQAEFGYGLRPPVGRGVLTPYAGLSAAGDGDGRTYRIGARWNAEHAFGLVLEGSHGDADGDASAATTATLSVSYRW